MVREANMRADYRGEATTPINIVLCEYSKPELFLLAGGLTVVVAVEIYETRARARAHTWIGKAFSARARM